MRNKFIREHSEFFENLSRKILTHINYAEMIDESLSEGSLTPLLIEAVDKAELKKLEDLAKSASTDADEFVAKLNELGFENTAKYVQGLKKELPSTFSLVKMAFGGDPKAAAEEIGKVTSVTSKIQMAIDSVADAVMLFGTELQKLPFAQETVWKKFEEENTDDQGKLTIPGLEDVKMGEFITKIKEEPLINVIKMAQEYEGLEGMEFPDEKLLRGAAENSYKEPEEPKGMWGKLMNFFGGKDMSAKTFADDILGASLAKLVDAANKMKEEAAEAEKDVQASAAVMDDIKTDVQALSRGESPPGAPGGGAQQTGATQQTTVDMPGAGDVPLTPQTIAQVAPGFDQSPEKAGDKKMVPIPELEKTVTNPEEVPEGEWLASLVNDDPKSSVVFFDPEAAKKAAEEAEKAKDTGAAKEEKPDQTKKEGWVHKRKMSDWLFETSMRRNKKAFWVHKSSLKSALFTEAIFYKDVAKALKAQGVEDADLPTKVAELAKRLENQYDVQISDIPEMETTGEAVAAAEQIQQAGLSAQDLKDILKQQGEANAQTMQMFKDILAAKDEAEVQRALARASEEGVQVTNVLTATAEASAESGSGGEEAPAEDDKKPGKPRDRTKPPTDKIKDRGKEVGLKPKKGETGEQFGRRVRKEEEKQGKRKPKKKKPKAKPKSTGGSKAKATATAETSTEALWHYGDPLRAHLVHRAGTLTEVLLGPDAQRNTHEITDDEETSRWTRLAGLEEE